MATTSYHTIEQRKLKLI